MFVISMIKDLHLRNVQTSSNISSKFNLKENKAKKHWSCS